MLLRGHQAMPGGILAGLPLSFCEARDAAKYTYGSVYKAPPTLSLSFLFCISTTQVEKP